MGSTMKTLLLFATAIVACVAIIVGCLAIKHHFYGLALMDAILALVNIGLWSFNYWIIP